MRKHSFLDEAAMKIDKYVAKFGVASPKTALRFAFWAFSRGWGVTDYLTSKSRQKTVDDDVCRVKIELFGGLGDLIIALNYLKYLEAAFEGKRVFDVYLSRDKFIDDVRNLCREQNFISEVRSVRSPRNNYDLELEIIRFPKIVSYNRKKIKRLSPKIATILDYYLSFFEKNSFFFRLGAPGYFIGRSYSELQGQKRLSQADLGGFLGVDVDFCPKIFGDVAATKAKFSLADGPYLTLQRGAGNANANDATKLWPSEKYDAFVDAFRRARPDVKVVQLGAAKATKIAGVDVDLRGKTSFEELKIVLAGAVCHLDGECGLVHLRRFLGSGPSVVLFGPTSETYFAYPENADLYSDVCAGGCEWLTQTYVQKCPRGFERCERIAQISVETVLQAVLETVERADEKLLKLRS